MSKESLEVLNNSGATSPADAALFNLGLVYAHQANPDKDYGKSLHYFTKLIQDFPASPLSEEATIWIGILDAIRAAQQKQQKGMNEKDTKKENPQFHPEHDLAHLDDFEAALKENQETLARSGEKPPADAALFNMGLIYAHYGNPKKDYKKSVMLLKRLVDEYPLSPLAEEARIWLGVFEVIERIQQVDIEIEEKKKEFTQ